MAKKQITIKRLPDKPKLDGKLDEEFWHDLPELDNFIQFSPYNGEKPSQKSIVKIGYDDEAIYIGAKLFDTDSDSIFQELSKRDQTHNINSDKLSIYLNPFNDGINSYYFTLTAAGVQSDMKITGDSRDRDWDAVWNSKVAIDQKGWSAEIAIPYSSLRFPTKDIQKWGFNFFRTIKRYDEQSVWSYISRETMRWWKEEQGAIKNIKGINPPLRLSFTPYLSGYLQKEGSSFGYSYTGGMDLTYGLNESFTLNMTLIPDFGQVQADNDVLNLSPFEIHHEERRPFFTEDIQLFNKGNIFYSRRIGGKPEGHNDVEDIVGEQDTILSNPDKTQLLNAIKLTGRTDKGLGIGVLNAITDQSYATVKDGVTDITKEIKTQPLTNYNVLVLDKSIRRNSYINFTNTNKYNNSYIANVSSTGLVLENEPGYSVGGYAALSQKIYPDSTSRGWRLKFNTGKNKGKYQYNYRIAIEDDTYDPNDIGFMRKNNEISQEIELEYNQYNPKGSLLNLFHSLDIDYETLYKPYEFTEFRITHNSFRTFKNRRSIFLRTSIRPVIGYDYNEPRQEGKFLITPKLLNLYFGFFPDSRETMYIRFRTGAAKSLSGFNKMNRYYFSLQPNLRLNSKTRINYNFNYRKINKDRGWVEELEEQIIFGKRNIRTITNTMNFAYIFSNTSSLDFYFRHYWSIVDYNKFYHLKDDGYLDVVYNYQENQNINYNSINLRMNFLWRFAPGSKLSFVWQKQIYSDNNDVNVSILENFQNTFNAKPLDSVSMKILYYLDYMSLFG